MTMVRPLDGVDHAPVETVGRVEYYLIDGQTPDEQLHAFRQVQRDYPDLVWQQAEATRHDGLTLFAERASGKKIALRCPKALCGYDGNGPAVAVKILVEAGFGYREHVEAHIYHPYEQRKETRCFVKK